MEPETAKRVVMALHLALVFGLDGKCNIRSTMYPYGVRC